MHSFEIKGFSCFGDSWVGFESFSPITVIIGRNNSGKSRFLSLVKLLTEHSNLNAEPPPSFEVRCKATLNEAFLKTVFSKNFQSDYGGTPWDLYSQTYLNAPVSFELPTDFQIKKLVVDTTKNPHFRLGDEAKSESEQYLKDALIGYTTPLYNKTFFHLAADRDIIPEEAKNELKPTSNGNGATNIIRRFVTSNPSEFDEDIIRVKLLGALDEIFGPDATFDRIDIREHDDKAGETDVPKMEVFLGEPHKGLVALSESGSGLKTVILVLLNLLVFPELTNTPLDRCVFAFEELENNLHPSLLRRLFSFLQQFVKDNSCTLFLTTHSSAAVDFFASIEESQLIHVSHDGRQASTKTIESRFDQFSVVDELGTKPSDILQANGIVWLEGPSDRIYVNRLIELFSNGELKEGKDYQCAFYAGSLLADVTFTEEWFANLPNLLNLNSNIAVICDGDRTASSGAGSVSYTHLTLPTILLV